MNERIVGFDLARAYGIFGMYVVNFNTVFGSHTDSTGVGKFLTLFNGNSSTAFVILAGMGVALMTNRKQYLPELKKTIRTTIIKRSWFLFIAGLLLYNWWPADILHFYGGYMHIAALLLFVPKRFYLISAVSAIILFHILLMIIPFETGWNFETLTYSGFWSIEGFLRSTLYNGWNPIIPWIAYFLLGMWLGRLDWKQKVVKKSVLTVGLIIFCIAQSIQWYAPHYIADTDLQFYLTADYLPPFLPFMVSTASFALILISICMFLGEYVQHTALSKALVTTGQMTLTHYIQHLIIGMLLLSLLTGKEYAASIAIQPSTEPVWILVFSSCYFLLSVLFSKVWETRYGRGPLEMLMRRIT